MSRRSNCPLFYRRASRKRLSCCDLFVPNHQVNAARVVIGRLGLVVDAGDIDAARAAVLLRGHCNGGFVVAVGRGKIDTRRFNSSGGPNIDAPVVVFFQISLDGMPIEESG